MSCPKHLAFSWSRIPLPGLFHLCLFFFSLSGLFTSSVYSLPILEFNPLLETEARYDDNIYLTRSNTRSDWITTISTGFITSLSHPRLNLDLEYKPGFVYFLHNPQHDYTRYDVNFNGALELSSRLTFSLYEVFLRANEPDIEELLETDYERRLRRERRFMFNRNIVAPQLEYHLGRESVARLYYRNTSFESEDPEEDDHRENFFEGELEHWFNMRNGLNLTCHFIKGNFENDTDILNSVDLTLRYMRRLTPHFKLYSEYGAGVSDFEETRFYQQLDAGRRYLSAIQDVEDYDLRKFNLGFEWILPRNLRLEGSIGYFWREGVANRDDQGLNSLFEIEKTTKNLTVTLSWESGYSANYFAIRDAGFSEFWNISTNLTYTYHDRLQFYCRGSYGYEEFTYGRRGEGFAIEGREDYRYMASSRLTYFLLKNYFFVNELSLDLEYHHTELDSSFEREYYINNQCMMRLRATFF